MLRYYPPERVPDDVANGYVQSVQNRDEIVGKEAEGVRFATAIRVAATS